MNLRKIYCNQSERNLKIRKIIREKVKIVHKIKFNFQKSEIRSILYLEDFLKKSRRECAKNWDSENICHVTSEEDLTNKTQAVGFFSTVFNKNTCI